MSRAPRIALISGIAVAAPPATDAIAAAIPDAVIWNLLDDRLISDAQDRGSVTPTLEDRMIRLIEHAVLEGADAIWLTCSLYGHLASRTSHRVGVPVLGPDDAAFDAVVTRDYESVYLVSSVRLALDESFVRATTAFGPNVTVVPVFAPAAREASLASDDLGVVAALISAINAEPTTAQAVVLANYSLAPAAAGIHAALGLPVIAGPAFAAGSIRDQIGARNAERGVAPTTSL